MVQHAEFALAHLLPTFIFVTFMIRVLPSKVLTAIRDIITARKEPYLQIKEALL
jgi:hypothetical protein